MIMVYPNKVVQWCRSCGCHVGVSEGFSVYPADGVGFPVTYCRSSLCLPADAYHILTRRELTKEGRIYMPYDANALPWLRQMPQAKFMRMTKELPYWQVSVTDADRPKVLDIAHILKLEVAPELYAYDAPGTDAEVEAAAAVTRGKEAGAYPYQLAGIRFIAERQRCLLGDQMGTGKTAQSLLAIPSEHGTLVIVPASVKYNWHAECKRWRPDLLPRVLHSDSLPAVLWPPAGEVWIINPDALPALPPSKSERKGFVFIISDEAHLYKNTRTKRHKAVRAWNDAATKVCIMTGTPMTNKPQDLWGTLSVAGLATQAFGSRSKFEAMFERTVKGDLVNPSPEVPKRLRQVMLRRRQDEVLKELPPSVYKHHFVSKVIPPALVEQLDDMYERIEKALNMEELPRLEDMSRVRSLLATFKVAEMHDLIDEYEEAELPLVVFSAHKEPVLSAADRDGWAAITGDTKPDERQAIVNAFQSGQLKGVSLTVQAGGVGLTLTRAAHMLFVDLDWTPALNAQAEARIKRIGQKAERVYYTTMVVRHPVDSRVLELLEHKMRVFREAIDDVAEEYKVTKAPPRVQGEFEHSSPTPYVETQAARTVRMAQQKVQQAHLANSMERLQSIKQAVAQRMPAIEALKQQVMQERARSSEAVRRHEARAGAASMLLLTRTQTPSYVHRPLDPERLRLGLAHLLSRCDGAQARDDVGFNALDARLARQMVYLDVEKNDEHAEAVARMLSKYKRQLQHVIPELFTEVHSGTRGHQAHRV